MTEWQPLQAHQDSVIAGHPAWEALVAALRPVAPQLREVAAAQLAAPSWRPGETAEHAAYAEGGKAVWRMLLALANRQEREA